MHFDGVPFDCLQMEYEGGGVVAEEKNKAEIELGVFIELSLE